MIALLDGGGEMTTSDIATAIGYPLRTTERTLDDLVAHGIAVVNRYGSGKATTWQITDWTAKNWAAATSPEKSDEDKSTSPEKSEDISHISLCTHNNDLSGEVGGAANVEIGDHGDSSTSSLTAAVCANGNDGGEDEVPQTVDETPRGARGDPEAEAAERGQ